jgi:protease secretion system membrane fusion protein
MARHRAEVARRPSLATNAAEAGDRSAPAAAYSIEHIGDPPSPVPSASLITLPVQRAGAVSARVTPVAWEQAADGGGSLGRVTRPRRSHLGWLVVLACASLAGLAFVPVSRDLVLPAMVVSYGEDRPVTSPTGGTVSAIRVVEGQKVEPGDLLLSIEPQTPGAWFEARRNWNRLKWQEARQLARLAGQTRLTRPTGLLPIDGGSDTGEASAEQERLLVQGLEQDRAMLEPLTQSVEHLEAALAEARAGRAATVEQLKTAEARLRKTAALRERNVIYDEGVYTEQLFDTLTQLTKGLRKEMAAQERLAAKAAADLTVAQEALAQRRLARAAELEAALARTREQLDATRARIARLEGQQSPVEVRAAWNGTVHRVDAPRIGGKVESGEALLTLRVPGGKAIVEALSPSGDRKLIRFGQPVKIILPGDRSGATVEYAGRVTHIRSPQRGSTAVAMEIDTSAYDRGAQIGLFGAMRGEAFVPTRQTTVRYLWRWMGGQ